MVIISKQRLHQMAAVGATAAATALCAVGTMSCNNGPSQAQLQHKLDSIAKLEAAERLLLQGIDPEAYDPMKAFIDSLSLQTLPVAFSEDFVESLPRFTTVPSGIVSLWELDDSYHYKAIRLPETLGARLVLLAVEFGRGMNLLWLYSLNDTYEAVDRLLLYVPSTLSNDQEGKRLADFSITSDYTIRVREYNGTMNKHQDWTYVVDPGRHFIRQ